jgi:predicted transcriptional regulator
LDAVGQAKREALELVERLPDSVTTDEILQALLFKAQVERGLRDAAEGRIISDDELLESIAEWRKAVR